MATTTTTPDIQAKLSFRQKALVSLAFVVSGFVSGFIGGTVGARIEKFLLSSASVSAPLPSATVESTPVTTAPSTVKASSVPAPAPVAHHPHARIRSTVHNKEATFIPPATPTPLVNQNVDYGYMNPAVTGEPVLTSTTESAPAPVAIHDAQAVSPGLPTVVSSTVEPYWMGKPEYTFKPVEFSSFVKPNAPSYYANAKVEKPDMAGAPILSPADSIEVAAQHRANELYKKEQAAVTGSTQGPLTEAQKKEILTNVLAAVSTGEPLKATIIPSQVQAVLPATHNPITSIPVHTSAPVPTNQTVKPFGNVQSQTISEAKPQDNKSEKVEAAPQSNVGPWSQETYEKMSVISAGLANPTPKAPIRDNDPYYARFYVNAGSDEANAARVKAWLEKNKAPAPAPESAKAAAPETKASSYPPLNKDTARHDVFQSFVPSPASTPAPAANGFVSTDFNPKPVAKPAFSAPVNLDVFKSTVMTQAQKAALQNSAVPSSTVAAYGAANISVTGFITPIQNGK